MWFVDVDRGKREGRELARELTANTVASATVYGTIEQPAPLAGELDDNEE